jgi:hypothetical protein
MKNSHYVEPTSFTGRDPGKKFGKSWFKEESRPLRIPHKLKS